MQVRAKGCVGEGSQRGEQTSERGWKRWRGGLRGEGGGGVRVRGG